MRPLDSQDESDLPFVEDVQLIAAPLPDDAPMKRTKRATAPVDPCTPNGDASPLLTDDRRRARRAVRFQEFGEILAFLDNGGQISSEPTSRPRPRLLENLSRTEAPDDETLAILESCELVEADAVEIPDARLPQIADNMPGMVRLTREHRSSGPSTSA